MQAALNNGVFRVHASSFRSAGIHDAANAVSTVIASKSLSPRQAVLMSAFFNTLPVVTGSSAVANTVSSLVALNKLEVVPDGAVPMGVRVACGALLAAILWNLATLHFGIPSSSSHALLGGLLGAGLAAGGLDVITWTKVQSAAIAIVASPALAGAVAMLLSFTLKRICQCLRLSEDHTVFRIGQIASACALSWSHGQNDAQKTMGVLSAALYSAGYLNSASAKSLQPPLWVMLSAFAAIGLGTAFGGFAIIETVALKLTRVGRASGMAANIGSITAIEGATALAIPISTTQAATAAVAGSGVGWGAGLQWRTLARMVVAWIITLPCATAAGYVGFWIMMIPSWGAPIVAFLVLLGLAGWTAFMVLTHTSAADLNAQVTASRAQPGAATSASGTASTGSGTAGAEADSGPTAESGASAVAIKDATAASAPASVQVVVELVVAGSKVTSGSCPGLANGLDVPSGCADHHDVSVSISGSGDDSDVATSVSAASGVGDVGRGSSGSAAELEAAAGMAAAASEDPGPTMDPAQPDHHDDDGRLDRAARAVDNSGAPQPHSGTLAAVAAAAAVIAGTAAAPLPRAALAAGVAPSPSSADVSRTPGISPSESPVLGPQGLTPPGQHHDHLARGWSPVSLSAAGSAAERDSFILGRGVNFDHPNDAFLPRGGLHVSESLASSSAASVATEGRSVSRASVATEVSDVEAPLQRSVAATSAKL